MRRWEGPAWAVLLLAAVAGCRPASSKPGSRPELPPVNVRTGRVSRTPLDRVVSIPGSIVAQDVATLSVKVPGRVRSLEVDLGSVVRAGEMIARIEPRDYELRLNEAMAALAQARARLSLPLDGTNDVVQVDQTSTARQAKAVLVEAEKKRDRIAELTRQKIISESELEAAVSEYEVAVNRYEDARVEVRLRQAVLAERRAAVDLARKELEDTWIRAPFNGTVQERLASPGAYLMPGAPVVVLVRNDALRIRAEVPEREAPRIRLGQEIRLIIDDKPLPVRAKLDRLSPALSELSRTLIIEADLPGDSGVRPGTFVRAEVVVSREAPALVVPAAAVAAFAGIEKLFVVEEGRASERNVTTGDRGPGWIEVVHGVRADEAVVLEPGGLQGGQKVMVMP